MKQSLLVWPSVNMCHFHFILFVWPNIWHISYFRLLQATVIFALQILLNRNCDSRRLSLQILRRLSLSEFCNLLGSRLIQLWGIQAWMHLWMMHQIAALTLILHQILRWLHVLDSKISWRRSKVSMTHWKGHLNIRRTT